MRDSLYSILNKLQAFLFQTSSSPGFIFERSLLGGRFVRDVVLFEPIAETLIKSVEKIPGSKEKLKEIGRFSGLLHARIFKLKIPFKKEAIEGIAKYVENFSGKLVYITRTSERSFEVKVDPVFCANAPSFHYLSTGFLEGFLSEVLQKSFYLDFKQVGTGIIFQFQVTDAAIKLPTVDQAAIQSYLSYNSKPRVKIRATGSLKDLMKRAHPSPCTLPAIGNFPFTLPEVSIVEGLELLISKYEPEHTSHLEDRLSEVFSKILGETDLLPEVFFHSLGYGYLTRLQTGVCVVKYPWSPFLEDPRYRPVILRGLLSAVLGREISDLVPLDILNLRGVSYLIRFTKS